MSKKRRDKKNRILHTGESQRADGKYMYRYVDFNGKTKCIYSWRLVNTDPIPAGKKDTGSLREKEKLIQMDLDDCIGSDKEICQTENRREAYDKSGLSNGTQSAGERSVRRKED